MECGEGVGLVRGEPSGVGREQRPHGDHWAGPRGLGVAVEPAGGDPKARPVVGPDNHPPHPAGLPPGGARHPAVRSRVDALHSRGAELDLG